VQIGSGLVLVVPAAVGVSQSFQRAGLFHRQLEGAAKVEGLLVAAEGLVWFLGRQVQRADSVEGSCLALPLA
jgi:hypothetical protein